MDKVTFGYVNWTLKDLYSDEAENLRKSLKVLEKENDVSVKAWYSADVAGSYSAVALRIELQGEHTALETALRACVYENGLPTFIDRPPPTVLRDLKERIFGPYPDLSTSDAYNSLLDICEEQLGKRPKVVYVNDTLRVGT